MDPGSRVIAGIFVVWFFVFLFLALSVYELKRKNAGLEKEIADLKAWQRVINRWSENTDKNVVKTFIASEDFYKENKERISILEESIDAKDKRWAKIKKVRQLIEDTSYNRLTILQLTAIASAVVEHSEHYDVELSLVLAVIRQESAFSPKVVSHAGAVGLMQVMPPTGREIAADLGKGRYSLYNIRDNVQFGSYYLRKMLDLFDGDISLAVRAYNCGPVYTKKVISGTYSGYPEETVDYLEKVLGWKEEYERRGL